MKSGNNVRSYGDWLKAGRQVRKGERSVRGLFHVSQTKPIDDRDPGFVDLDRMSTSAPKGTADEPKGTADEMWPASTASTTRS